MFLILSSIQKGEGEPLGYKCTPLPFMRKIFNIKVFDRIHQKYGRTLMEDL